MPQATSTSPLPGDAETTTPSLRSLLYYHGAADATSYGHTPSSYLSVPRLMDGLAPFRQNESWIEKKKTLLVNAAAMLDSNAHEAQALIIKERLEALARKGFEVYVFFEGSLCLWDDVKRRYFSSSKERIELPEASARLNRSADELLVLDEHLLKRLIEGDDEDWAAYADPSIHVLDLSYSNLSAASLTKLLELKHEHITELNLSACLNLKGFSLPEHLDFPKLRVLTLGADKKYYLRPLAPLGSCSYRTSLPRTALSALIKRAPCLEVLNINYCDAAPDTLMTIENPENLRELYLNDSSVSRGDLKELLQKMKDIRALSLDGFNRLDEILSSALRVGQIEVLSLDGAVNQETLRGLLLNASHLKRLKLQDSRGLSYDWINSLHLSLNVLETLDLGCSDISTEALEALISRAPKLKALRLYHCKQLTGRFSRVLELAALEELYLSHSGISTQALEALISRASNLKRLHLFRCSNLIERFSDTLKLSALEELDLSASNISTEALEVFIGGAPNLKRLLLLGCENLIERFSPTLKLSAFSGSRRSRNPL